MNPWPILAGLILCSSCWIGGCTTERHSWQVKAAQAESVADARSESLQDIIKLKDDTHAQVLDFVAAVHERDLDSLRNRPPRRIEVVRDGACSGSTGAELSRPDAEFLAGEAARAERVLEGLRTLTGKYNQLLKSCSSAALSEQR